MKIQKEIHFHTIDEVPESTLQNNPYVALFWETSLVPDVILIQDYRKRVNEFLAKSMDMKGCLIGWIYFGELLSQDCRLELINIAAKNNYYKDLKL